MHFSLVKSNSTFSDIVMDFGIVLLFISLAGCGGGNAVTTQPTPTAPSLLFTNYDLKLPAKALNAPIVGDVPGNQHSNFLEHSNPKQRVGTVLRCDARE